MQKNTFLLLCALALPASAPLASAEAPLSMADFAHGAELTPGQSALRSFELQPVVIRNIRRADLGDIRVFDANNTRMPSLARTKDGMIRSRQQRLTATPLRAAGKSPAYLLDRGEQSDASVKSLQLHWKRGREPHVLGVKVEHSPDRKNWTTIETGAAVANFDFKGVLLKQNVIDINRPTERYLRLTLIDGVQSPVLVSVDALMTDRTSSEHWWIQSGRLEPLASDTKAYRFTLDEGIHPELFKLTFPKLNSVLTGTLGITETAGGKRVTRPVVDDFIAYAVTLNNYVVRSRPVDITRWPVREWHLKVGKSINLEAASPPGVMLGYPRYEVIFAADGEEPYTAVWGNATAGEPSPGRFSERLRTMIESGGTVAEVKTGILLDNARLREIVESGRIPWTMLIAGLLVIALAVVVYKTDCRRYFSRRKGI